MVPQQSQDGSTAATQSEQSSIEQNDSMAIDDLDENLTVFGSQQVKETSNTPYSDATKVSNNSNLLHTQNYWKIRNLIRLGITKSMRINWKHRKSRGNSPKYFSTSQLLLQLLGQFL